MNHDHFIVTPGSAIRLKDYDPGFTAHYKDKDEASAKLRKDIKQLAKYQNVLYAQNTYALLVMLQAMDTAGKDGTIRHVMSGVNPQRDDYMNAFEETFNHTSTEWAPWHIIPADKKWFTRTVVADVIVEKLKSLNLSYPEVSEEHRKHLLEAKELLENEPDSGECS